MRVLVTGSSGTVGTTVVPALRAAGHEVVLTTRRPEAAEPPTIRYLELGEPIDPRVLDGVDAVVHLAARSDRRSRADRSAFERVNHLATAELACAAATRAVSHFVLASTVLVHGDRSREPISADSPARPADDYSRSKLAAERAVLAALEGRADVDILRMAAVCDALEPSEVARRIVARLPVVPVPRTDNHRSTISPAGVAGAIVDALARPPDGRVRITTLADGEAGFRRDVELAIRELGSRRIVVAVPNPIWRIADRFLGRLGGPSLAGVHDDLIVDGS